MVHDTSNTAGGEKTGPAADSNDPTSRIHAHARTHETDRAAIEWADGECARLAMAGPIPAPFRPTVETDMFTRDFVLAAFAAGRASAIAERAVADVSRAVALSAIGLLTEAGLLFRRYEAHHQAKVDEGRSNHGHAPAGAIEKVKRNADMADRIDAFLVDPTVPRDTLTGLALSLVQDLDALMQDSGGVYGLHLNGYPAPWETLTAEGKFSGWLGSFDRLRDHLDWLFPTGSAGTHNPVQVADRSPAQPVMSAPVSFMLARLDPDDIMRGAVSLLRPGDTVLIVEEHDGGADEAPCGCASGAQGAPVDASCPVHGLPHDEDDADPAATVRTIEAAVAGGLIPGITNDRLSTARVEARLFPAPVPGVYSPDQGLTPDAMGTDAMSAQLHGGMDPEVVDALRQAHDGTA